LLITALESLKDHTNPKYDYQIHILIEELSEKNVALISAMAEKNVTI
jgi:lipopolysaccharide biosynthesis glycosyltransferase